MVTLSHNGKSREIDGMAPSALPMSPRTADLVGIAAWAGGQRETIGGVMIRRAGGFTDRANSAVALGPLSGAEAADAVTFATMRAVADGVDDRWQVSDHETELATVLAARGFVAADPTLVMVRAAQSDRRSEESPEIRERIDRSAVVTDEWFATWSSGSGHSGTRSDEWLDTARAFFESLPDADVGLDFVRTESSVGLGIGVEARSDEDQAVAARFVCALATLPSARGRGLGSAMLHQVLAPADLTGRCSVLQVESSNPAVRIYEAAGFRLSHTYRHVRRVAGD